MGLSVNWSPSPPIPIYIYMNLLNLNFGPPPRQSDSLATIPWRPPHITTFKSDLEAYNLLLDFLYKICWLFKLQFELWPFFFLEQSMYKKIVGIIN
jgi:hypothetical protein